MTLKHKLPLSGLSISLVFISVILLTSAATALTEEDKLLTDIPCGGSDSKSVTVGKAIKMLAPDGMPRIIGHCSAELFAHDKRVTGGSDDQVAFSCACTAAQGELERVWNELNSKADLGKYVSCLSCPTDHTTASGSSLCVGEGDFDDLKTDSLSQENYTVSIKAGDGADCEITLHPSLRTKFFGSCEPCTKCIGDPAGTLPPECEGEGCPPQEEAPGGDIGESLASPLASSSNLETTPGPDFALLE